MNSQKTKIIEESRVGYNKVTKLAFLTLFGAFLIQTIIGA